MASTRRGRRALEYLEKQKARLLAAQKMYDEIPDEDKGLFENTQRTKICAQLHLLGQIQLALKVILEDGKPAPMTKEEALAEITKLGQESDEYLDDDLIKSKKGTK